MAQAERVADLVHRHVLQVGLDKGGRLGTVGIEVAAGRSIDLAVVAPAAGNYPVKCTHFTHAMRGMKGEIIVDGETGEAHLRPRPDMLESVQSRMAVRDQRQRPQFDLFTPHGHRPRW